MKKLMLIIVLNVLFLNCGAQSPSMQEKLYYTCKVWGFVKYYHSEVSVCHVNWDSVLLAVLPDVRSAANSTEFNDALMEMLNAAGLMALSTTYFPDTLALELKRNRDWSWISTPTLRSDVQAILDTIKNNFRPHASCWYKNNSYTTPYYGYLVFPYDSIGLDVNTTVSYPNRDQRLMMLFKYWNIVRYFNPYNYVSDKPWDSVLYDYVVPIADASSAYDLYVLYLKIATFLDDAHVYGMTNSSKIQSIPGFYRPFIRLKYIDSAYVVINSLTPDIVKGDVIVSIDGLTTAQLEDSLKQYYSSGNLSVLRRTICENILGRQFSGTTESIIVRDSMGTDHPYTVACISPMLNLPFFNDAFYPADSLKAIEWTTMPCDIGYVNIRNLQPSNAYLMYDDLRNKPAIIFDLRYGWKTYPDYIAPLIYSTYSIFAKLSYPDITYPGTYFYYNRYAGNSTNPTPYTGKVIILVNEDVQSSSEFACMTWEQMPDKVVVGSQTAGADGSVSYWKLSQDLNVGITTLGVYYPNGDSTQRIGIVPDIVAYPTRNGIRAGRDEVLERALVAGGCNLGTSTTIKAPEIKIHPNPADDEIAVSITSTSGRVTVTLTDITGRELLNQEMISSHGNFSTTLDIKRFSPGMYFVAVFTDGQKHVKKVVKR